MVSKKKGSRRMSKKMRRRSHKKRRQSGGGYTDVLNLSISPGNQVHQQYTGPGKDCPGSPLPPGYMSGIGSMNGGLPGLNQAGGGQVQGVSVADGSVPSPASGFPFARELAPRPPLYHGGRRMRLSKKQKKLLLKQQKQQKQQQKQQGGRYGSFPDMGPLNPTNGVGTIGSPFLRVGCEAGTTNLLNPNPGGIQSATTAVTASPAGWTEFALTGGKRRARKTQKKRLRGQTGGASLAGGVSVGEMDSMRYYAPTAGYSNWPMTPAVGGNPGVMMQTGYPAGHFNEACMKTN